MLYYIYLALDQFIYYEVKMSDNHNYYASVPAALMHKVDEIKNSCEWNWGTYP